MRHLGLAIIGLGLMLSPALAQTAGSASGSQDGQSSGQVGSLSDSNLPGEVSTMAELLRSGYEIKASVPSGSDKLIIFMQNEKSAYACEFTNVENTRCGSIN